MAYRSVYNGQYGNQFNINSALGNPDFQKLLLSRAGLDQPVKKESADFLSRILALPSAIGSIPDAIYGATEGENPGERYLKNLGKGLDQAITGNKVADFKTTSDLLKKGNILQNDDILSKMGNFVLSFGGDVLLDPSSYLSFGTTGIAKGAAQAAAKSIGKKVAEKGAIEFGEKGATDLAKILSKQGSKGATEYLSKQGIQDAGKLVKEATQGMDNQRVAKFFGKELPSPFASKIAEAAINPLGFSAGYGWKKLSKYAPELTEGVSNSFNKLFNAKGAAKSQGLQDLYEKIGNYNKEIESTGRYVSATQNQLLDKVNKLTPEEQNILPQLIETGRIPNGVSEDLKKIIQDVKPILQDQGDRLQKAGLLSPISPLNESEKLIKNSSNTTSNLVENYFPRNVKGYNEDFVKNKFGDQAENILSQPEIQKSLKKNGYVDLNELNNVIKSKPFISGNIKGVENASKFLDGSDLQRTYNTLAEGEKAGVVYNKNAAQVLGDNLVKSEQALKTRAFAEDLKNVADDSGNKLFRTVEDFGDIKNIPANFREITGVKGLEGHYAPREASEMIKNYAKNFTSDEGTNKLLQTYDKALSIFKSSVTSLSPNLVGYHIRNMLGDMSNMLIGGFGIRGGIINPGEVAKSFKKGFDTVSFEGALKKLGKDEAIRKFGEDTFDLYKKVLQYGIVGSGTQALDEFGSTRTLFDKFSKSQNIKEKVGKAAGKVKEVLTYLPEKREDAFRIANFFDHYKQTGNWDEAAKLARGASLDYSNLTTFERNVMKRIIPFYSFLRQNLEHQLNTFMNHPARIVTQQKFLKDLGDSMSINEMSEEDWQALPEWMRTGLSVATGRKGNKVDILTGFGDPTSAVNDVIGNNPVDTIKNLLGSSSPLIKTPIELATGKNLFTGSDINENTDGRRYKDYPKWVKDMIGYKEIKSQKSDGTEYTVYRIDPEKAYALENTPVISPYNTFAKRVSDVAGSEGDPKFLINMLSGGRIYSKDLDAEKAKKEREELNQLNQDLVKLGIALPQQGVRINPTLSKNYPELAQILSQMGYNPKQATPVERQKRSQKKDTQDQYVKEILNQYMQQNGE